MPVLPEHFTANFFPSYQGNQYYCTSYFKGRQPLFLNLKKLTALKNFTFLATVLFLLLNATQAYSQKQQQPEQTSTRLSKEQISTQTTHRCGTDQMIEHNLRTNPEFRAEWEAKQRQFEESKNSVGQRTTRTSALTGPVTIPVVVHIVLPNPNIVTDADVEYFINALNRDFSGFNADSANGAPFYGVRGHSLLRFQLARRTPGGQLTNGIERRVGNVLIGTTTYQPIKHTSAGGLDPWDITQYYNIWVGGASGGLLGIAPTIGVGNQTETTSSSVGIDGVCMNYQAFVNNPCYTIPAFNLARTGIHEVGHNFGLYHTFQGGCNNADFNQILAPTTGLPASLLSPADDTPAQNNPTSGCPSGMQAANCSSSPNPPGRMYQNYMDYTDDACYSMFTDGQVERMHYILETFRPGYLTTQGHIPPAGTLTMNAAALESVNPGGSEVVGCTPFSYPSALNCGGSLQPKFRFRNDGTTTITSIRAGYILDNGAPVFGANPFTVNVPMGHSAVLTLPAINPAPGAHTIKFFTYDPNGAADQSVANDTITVNFTVATGLNLPVSESFTSTTFPPAGWSVVNPNAGSITWARYTGTGTSVPAGTPYSAPASAWIDLYSYSSNNHLDFLWSPPVSLGTPADSVVVTFRLSHQQYGSTSDSLELVYSADCGTTWQRLGNYYKWSGGTGANALATITPSCFCDAPPGNASNWRLERIAFRPMDLPGNPSTIMVGWKVTNRFGNNIYIDDINIEKKLDRDIRMVSINNPTATVCTPTFTPSVTVQNNGAVAVNTYTINYRIGTGAIVSQNITAPLAAGASATHTLPNASVTPGTYNFNAFISNAVFATAGADQALSNDTATRSFTLLSIATRVQEGFESTPVVGWTVVNPNNNNTWVRRSPGRNSTWSAFINNYDFNLPGQTDDLRAPAVNVTNADSVVISFDLAGKYYDNTFADTLSVMVSTDCGNTFTNVWRVWGPTLGAAMTSSFLNPTAADWRTVRIALGGANVASGSVIVQFRNTNRYGNNIFLDNINIEPKFRRDLQMLTINNPNTVVCEGPMSPSVTVRNNGSEAITAFKVGYTINNGAPQQATFTGVNIAPNATSTVTLPSTTLAPGQHTIRAYTFDPVTVSGTGDLATFNDSLSKTFSAAGSVNAPLVEGFEGASFPPANWSLVNPDNGITWSKAPVGRASSSSAFVNTYNYPSNGQRDELYTPVIKYSGVDSVKLKFDIAAVTYSYPGTTGIPIDTLEVILTKDCGNTFTTIYKKWGEDLQTINDPNYPQSNEFFPTNTRMWRTDSVDLTAYANDPSIMIAFRLINNYENNVFIDNVSVTTRTLPALLKQRGYLVLPTAFQNSFALWHHQTPTKLKYVTVYNAAGQQVWTKQFNGNADKYMTIDLTGRSAGTYFVHIGYEDEYRNVVEKVVKY